MKRGKAGENGGGGWVVGCTESLVDSLNKVPAIMMPKMVMRKVVVRLPGKEESNSHEPRPVHLIITTMKWIQTSRLPIKKSLSDDGGIVARGARRRRKKRR
jgi:hypothetical protein